MKLWTSIIIERLNKKIIDACFQLIKSQRNDSSVNIELIPEIVKSYGK